MTREEAIEYWEGLRKTFSSQLEKEENHFGRMHLQTTIDAIDMAISALRQQEHFRDITKKVEPLTLNELREMVGEPVWCKELECYGIIKIETIGRFANTPFLIGVYHDFDLGTAVNFEYDIKRRHFSLYRQKPEEGTT